jgi:hypothetical protein
MKHYLLSVYQPDGDPPADVDIEQIARNVSALNDEMKAAGAWIFADGLHAASSATVVEVKGGEVLVTDGPYAEGKEHVGGLCIVRAPDLDAALEWGRKSAEATTLPVEVRPFQGDADH